MAIPSSDTKITPFRNDRPVEGSRDAPLRALPHNIEAEQGLLGSLLRNNRAYEKVAEFLRPDHFANIVHGRIYEALGRLIDRGQIADPVTLRNVFEHDDGLAEAGGAGKNMRIPAQSPSTANLNKEPRAGKCAECDGGGAIAGRGCSPGCCGCSTRWSAGG